MKPLDFPLLTDENVDAGVIEGLRERSHDVQTVFGESLVGCSDETILEHCREGGRVVVTHDGDFGELAVRAGRGFLGIIYLRPGHISADTVLKSIDALASLQAEVSPPFIVIVTQSEGWVRVRAKTVASSAGSYST